MYLSFYFCIDLDIALCYHLFAVIMLAKQTALVSSTAAAAFVMQLHGVADNSTLYCRIYGR